MAEEYAQVQVEVAPKWIKRGDGETWLAVSGTAKDQARQYILSAIRNRFQATINPRETTSTIARDILIAKASNDALVKIGTNFDLERPEILTYDQYRDMLQDAWNIWIRSGTAQGIITEVKRLGFTNVTLLPVMLEAHLQILANYYIKLTYQTFAVEQNELFQCTLGQSLITELQATENDGFIFNTDDIEPGGQLTPYWDSLKYIWSAFYVVIGQEHPFDFLKWGDVGLDGGAGPIKKYGKFKWGGLRSSTEQNETWLRRIASTIQKFTAGHTSCRGILFHMPTTIPRRLDTVVVTQDAMTKVYTESLVTVNLPAINNVDIWGQFNWGGGLRYGAGFLEYRMREEWEVDEQNTPNIRDQW